MDPKTMVYLHSGILCSTEKEGAYTLCNSMDGTGEHYARWNKPDGEGQIPYDLTFNWNIINRMISYSSRSWWVIAFRNLLPWPHSCFCLQLSFWIRYFSFYFFFISVCQHLPFQQKGRWLFRSLLRIASELGCFMISLAFYGIH